LNLGTQARGKSFRKNSRGTFLLFLFRQAKTLTDFRANDEGLLECRPRLAGGGVQTGVSVFPAITRDFFKPESEGFLGLGLFQLLPGAEGQDREFF
jgi:hypothetical protein